MCAAGNQIVDRVRHLVATVAELDVEEVGAEALFYEELEIDSLQKAEISVRVEHEFGVQLRPEDTASIRTVNDVANFLRAQGIAVGS
jgi:acyl carrier protein